MRVNVDSEVSTRVARVPAAFAWKNNGELMADVAKLGYLSGKVLDCTYGIGTFWKVYRPVDLTASDLYVAKSPIGYSVDFTAMPFAKETFDTVVLDPPYKLEGRSNLATGWRYGLTAYVPWREVFSLIKRGITECSRVLAPKGHLLLKCQDEVCSGQVRWQTIEFANHGESMGLSLVDRFDMLGGRTQPTEKLYCGNCDKPSLKGQRCSCGAISIIKKPLRQKHAHGRPSTLLVFKKLTRTKLK